MKCLSTSLFIFLAVISLAGFIQPAWAVVQQPMAAPAKVISFTLIDADADVAILPLIDGHTINLAKLPTDHLNIRVNVQPPEVGSVVIVLNGNKRTENVVPYAAKGDTGGDYISWTPTPGMYQITSTPYDQPNGKGTAGEVLTILFYVVDDAARPELVVENYWDGTSAYHFLLEQGESDSFYYTMKASDEGTLPTPAAVTPIDDATNDYATWLGFTSASNQDTGYDFFVNSDGLIPGIYTATVIFGPVEGYDPEVVKVILEVSDSPLPFISFVPPMFDLTFEQGEDGRYDYKVVASDDKNGEAQIVPIDLATGQPATWLGFTSSTSFDTEYTMFIDTDMPPGTYYAALYAKAFSYEGVKYKDAKAELVLTLNPAFKIVNFFLINADNDQFMLYLDEDTEIDVATLPTKNLNIQAKTYPEVTGSVQFMVNGKSRTENVFPYAAFGDTNGDYFAWTPTPGNYTLKATPYSQPNRKGEKGEPLTIHFTVIDSPSARQLAEEASVQLNAYPNPSVREFTLDLNLPNTENVAVDLYDNGTFSARVFEGTVEAHTLTRIPIDATHLKNGIYFARIITGNQVISRRLVVVK